MSEFGPLNPFELLSDEELNPEAGDYENYDSPEGESYFEDDDFFDEL